MSLFAVGKPVSTFIGIVASLTILLASPVAFGAQDGPDVSPDDIVAELKPKLDLNDQQVKDITAALAQLAKKLDALIAAREAAKEDEHPDEFIKGVKQAQADYQEELKKILSASQLDAYNKLREQVIMDAMKDLAEIKLLDIQPMVKFSDEQLQKLIPVVAQSMREFIKIAWENAGKRLRVGQKIRLARDLKRIQSKSQQQVQQILTAEQFQTWEEIKKQAQEQRKSGMHDAERNKRVLVAADFTSRIQDSLKASAAC